MGAKSFRVVFCNNELENNFNRLKEGTHEEKELAAEVQKAIDKLYLNPFCGIKIPEKLWPRYYVREYEVENLWKYDLRGGWRLIYSLQTNQVEIISVLLEWFDHKSYERRFNY